MTVYRKVFTGLWTGPFGRWLRSRPDEQRVALYLMTCPHSTMHGVFYCPPMYIAAEVGMSLEGASKALRSLSEEGFVVVDEASDLVWVVEMAHYQIDATLKPTDKRQKGVVKDYLAIENALMRKGFFERYGAAYSLPEPSPIEGASKPLPSQKQKQKQKQEDYLAIAKSDERSSDEPDDVDLAEEQHRQPAVVVPIDTGDHNREAWRRGVTVLAAAGLTEAKARSLFGKLLRDHALEAGQLLPSIINAERNGTEDPQAYLTAAARGVAQRGGGAPAYRPGVLGGWSATDQSLAMIAAGDAQ